MNNVKLKDIKIAHINPLHFYTLMMRKQKDWLSENMHSPLQQKE